MSSSAFDPLRIPAELWHRDDVGQALDRRNVGRLFQLVRRYTGASQTRIGIATGLSQGTVSLYMSGSRVVTAVDLLERVADGLGMPDQARLRLGLAPRRRPRTGAPATPPGPDHDDEPPAERVVGVELRELLHDAVVNPERRPAGRLMAGVERLRQDLDRTLTTTGPITQSHVDDLEAAAHANARQCLVMPPIEMLCRLTLDLAEVRDLLAYRQRPLVQKGLYRVVSLLATLLADELMVLGDVRQSRAWHSTARFAADQTDDAALKADVRTLTALLHLYYGDASEAVTIARQAQGVGEGATGLSVALAPTYEALGLAQLGDVEGSEAALSVARERVETPDPRHRDESVLGFSERRWRFYEGKVLSYLGHSHEAWLIHDEALALYPEDVVGDPALIRFDRAISLVRDGQVPAGCELAGQTLVDLPDEHRTDIFMRAARRVLSAVPAGQRTSAPAQQYKEMIGPASRPPSGLGQPPAR